MKNPFLFFIAFLSVSITAFSQQKITPTDLKILQKKEDSLKVFAKAFLTEAETADRMRQDSLFIKTLIRSLQIKIRLIFPLTLSEAFRTYMRRIARSAFSPGNCRSIMITHTIASVELFNSGQMTAL